MQTDFVYFIPQSHKIRKGGGFVLRLPEQGSGVEGAHEPHAVLLHKGAVLLGHGEISADHPLGGDAAQADHDLWLQQPELFPEPWHTGLALSGQRVTVLGRAALDDVGNVAVFAPVQIDGKQVFVQQLAAAAHKGQTLFVLALARAFAHEQHLSSLGTLPEHHMGAVGTQLASAAGKAFGL